MSNKLNKVQLWMNDKVLPKATKFGNHPIILSISSGLMYTLPLTLAASFFSLLSNFPIKVVSLWFEQVGLTPQFNALMGGTLNIIALLITVSIPYSYTKLKSRENTNPLMAAFIALSSFVILMPQTVGEGISALSFDYLGSSGMFVSIILGISVAEVYGRLTQNKKLLVKMPEGVPPMVSQSFEPLIVSSLILVMVMFIRFGLMMTPIDNLFNLIQMVIANPLLKLGGSPFSLLIIAIIANSLFFIGIHPNVINTAITPLLYTMVLTAIEAYSKGITDLPYKVSLITNGFTNNDAVGSTLSLLIAILIFGKSQRYRSLAKMTVLPNVFNINEPVIFGLPIMLNPILFIPFILSTLITGLIGYLGAISGFISYYNPIVSIGIPWTVPRFISSFLSMGWQGLTLRIICMIIMVFVYLPFFKILDRQELEKEKQLEHHAEV